MLRERSFTLTAMGSLALGIAATTAMFSVIYAVIIDPFPYCLACFWPAQRAARIDPARALRNE